MAKAYWIARFDVSGMEQYRKYVAANWAWQDNGTALPGIETYAEQLGSRALYDEAASRGCVGF